MGFQHRFVQGLGVEKRTHPPHLLGRILLAITLLVLGTQAAQAVVQTCSDEWLPPGDKASPPDLRVTGRCPVKPGTTYYYGNVNILAGGLLLFYEAYADGSGSTTDLWASSIIIENGGELFAYGRDYDKDKNLSWQPFGFNGGVLTIHLYGKNEASWNPDKQQFDKQNQGALCKSAPGTAGAGQTPAPCGIPQATWNSNGASKVDLPGLDGQGKQISDYFYKYGPLHGDAWCNDAGSVFDKAAGACTSGGEAGYFGNKVLAVSYGGTLVLKGYKGASYLPDYEGPDGVPWSSGPSWTRLADGQSLKTGDTSLVLERNPNDSCYVTNAPPQPCWGKGLYPLLYGSGLLGAGQEHHLHRQYQSESHSRSRSQSRSQKARDLEIRLHQQRRPLQRGEPSEMRPARERAQLLPKRGGRHQHADGGFFANQRLSNIYDGPSYQDSNAYLDITVADCPIWGNHTEQGCMYGAQINILRLRKTPLTTPPDPGTVVPACQKPGVAYLPNAAIGWKQPNGFYYPPAFHSRNLFFSNVDLRHYVIDPLFKDGTYLTDDNAVRQQYCTATGGIFNDWTATTARPSSRTTTVR